MYNVFFTKWLALFLAGKGKLTQAFNVESVSQEKKNIIVTLIPKSAEKGFHQHRQREPPPRPNLPHGWAGCLQSHDFLPRHVSLGGRSWNVKVTPQILPNIFKGAIPIDCHRPHVGSGQVASPCSKRMML